MTATTAGTVAVPGLSRDTFFDVVRSEWTKIRTVRSTFWSLGLLVVLSVLFTAVLIGLTVAGWDDMTATDRALLAADPTAVILGSGFLIAQPAVCVLGVMAIASEYSTGMIRASLLAVPQRLPMLAGKAFVLAGLVFSVGLVTAFSSYFAGAASLGSRIPVSLGDPGALRAVVGTALYLAALAVFSLAIGALLRHTAAGITAVIGFVLVLAPLVGLIPGKAGEYLHAYLPTEAGILIAQATQGPSDVLSPWQGFLVFCVWTVALLAVAGYLFKRRDA
jgi:ABC-type transport system involved in multi-copper enzyme maturation permease subunit